MATHLAAIPTVAAFLLLVATDVGAQAPAHATLLAQTWGTAQWRLLQTGDVVHAFEPPKTHYSRSADGGRTWPIVAQDLGPMRLDAVAVDGDLLAACGAAFGPVGVGGPAITVSADLGLTWSPLATIATWSVPPTEAETRVHVTGQTVVLVWTEPGTGSVWMRRSTDGGLTWPGSNVLLDQEPPPAFSIESMDLHLVGDGPTIHLFWRPRTTGLVYVPRMQSSSDAGQTWLPAARPTVPASFTGSRTAVAGDSSTLLLSDGGGPLHRSTDGGVTWTLAPGQAAGFVQDIAFDGSSVVVVRLGAAAGTPALWTIQVSPDAGQTWPNPPFVDSSTIGFFATAHVSGSDLYVDFVHTTQPGWSLLAHSGDGGLTWTALQFGVAGFSAGPRRNVHVHREPTVLPFFDCYVYVGLGWSMLGTGTAGTGGETPLLRLQGMPRAGRTADFAVENARGTAIGVLGVTWEQPLPVPFAGGDVWLQLPWLLVPFATGGSPGGAGVGSWALPFDVPNNPAVVGARLTGQAAILDPSAAASLALTHGIEIWMR